MSIIEILLISLGLAMDAFAVSVTSGVTYKNMKVQLSLRIALFFGIFQAVMPLIGWSAGQYFKSYVESFDHWIAFALLVAIGGKMIYEARIMEETEKRMDCSSYVVLAGLALATSIDALAVGLSFSFLKIDIILPVIIIGLVTFVLSYAGVLLGKRFGHLFENKMEIIGGLVLIGIGLKILLQHLFFV